MESEKLIRHGASIAFNASRIDDPFHGYTVGQAMQDLNAKKKKWLQFRLQASSGFVGLPNRLVDSKAFASLTTGASVKTLIWFWQKVKYGKRGKKRGKKHGTESPIGRIDMIENNGELSFTYQEAGWRGMNAKRFSRALKDLHRLGFIDITRLGRGVKGEYTKYAISNRWEKYDTADWEEIPFPKNFREGFREDAYRKKSKEKNSGRKCPLLTDENVRYEVEEQSYNGRKRPLKTSISRDSQRTISSVSIDLAMPIGTSKGSVEKVQNSDTGSKSIPALIRRKAASTSPK